MPVVKTRRLPDFNPPPVMEGTGYMRFQRDALALPARSLVKRLRAAGLDAYAEQTTYRDYAQGTPGLYYYDVFVAQPHFLCALIVWRLRGRGVGAWREMSSEQRSKIALQALVDGAVMSGENWDDVFDPVLHVWLKGQLGLTEPAFQKLVGQALRRFRWIVKRDVRLGLAVTAACLAIGLVWGLTVSFNYLPVWIFLTLGVVFGVFTLAYTLPKALNLGTFEIDDEHSSKDAPRKPVVTRPVPTKAGIGDVAASAADRELDYGEQGGLFQDLGDCLERVKEHLNRGDAESGLKALEAFAARDVRGVHTSSPDYYELLRICQSAVGKDSRNAEALIEETKLDWMTALKKGEQLLRAGKAQESIRYFKRSLRDNPGEAGTASAEETARQGIAAAEKILKRRKKT